MELLLDIGQIEEDFFDEAQLIGLQTSMSSSKLCWLLEQRLGLCFERKLLDDIAAHRFNEIPAEKQSGTLFDEVVEERQDIYFQVFRHRLKQSSSETMFLYSNHEGGYILLPEHKNFDYFLLIKDKTFRLENEPLSFWLRALPELSQGVQELDLSKIVHKMHMII